LLRVEIGATSKSSLRCDVRDKKKFSLALALGVAVGMVLYRIFLG
jgi:hypothetical protein